MIALQLIKPFKDIELLREFYNKKMRNDFYNPLVRKIIKQANSKYQVSSIFDLMYVFNDTPLKGLVNTLFEPDNFDFTCKNIAIAVHISVRGYVFKSQTNNEAVIDFAYYFCNEIEKTIKSNRLLSEELLSINKKIELMTECIDRDEIAEIFSSKKKIFEHYFQTFEASLFNDEITIFHQAENKEWIEWNEEDSITIRVNLQKIRRGFFLPGFDYSSKTHRGLSVVTTDGCYEYFNGEMKGDHTVWLN